MKTNNIDHEINTTLEEEEEDKDFDEQLFHYYENNLHNNEPIDPVKKIKLMGKIYKYDQKHNHRRNLLRTISAASLIGISVFLFSRFTLETKINQNIEIID